MFKVLVFVVVVIVVAIIAVVAVVVAVGVSVIARPLHFFTSDIFGNSK